jgi:hypothetical protein
MAYRIISKASESIVSPRAPRLRRRIELRDSEKDVDGEAVNMNKRAVAPEIKPNHSVVDVAAR